MKIQKNQEEQHTNNPKDKNIFSNLYIVISLLILSFTLGAVSFSIIYQKDTSQTFKEIRSPGKYNFVNPLLECEYDYVSNNSSIQNISSNVKDIINKEEDTFISFYYRDLNNGPWFGINEKELFTPASLLKIPIMMAYYKMSEKNTETLSRKILIIQDGYYENANYLPEELVLKGQYYTVEELINRMIIYSDNVALTALIDNIDPEKVNDVISYIKVDMVSDPDGTIGDIISVKEYASFFRILYNASYLNEDMSEKALELLTKTRFPNGLRAKIPSNIAVASKFGERSSIQDNIFQLHECGIVYVTNKPYLICIMTKGKDPKKLENIIQDISYNVYQEVNKNK